MHHFAGSSPSPTQPRPPKSKTKNPANTHTQTHHLTDLVQFPFFLQTSFCPPPLPPTQGKPSSLQSSLFALFLRKSTSSALEAVEDGGSEAARSVGSAPPSVQPWSHVQAVGSSLISVAEDELVTPCRGSPGVKGPLSPCSKEPDRVQRAERSAAPRPGSRRPSSEVAPGEGAEAGSRERGLFRRPAAPGDDTAFPPHPGSPCTSSFHPHQGTIRPTRISKFPVGGERCRQVAGTPPSARGPKSSHTATWLGSRAGSVTAGSDTAQGLRQQLGKNVSPHPGKVRRHLRHANLSSRTGLELSAGSGWLHSPKRPCRSRSDPGRQVPRPRPSVANHRAPRAGKAGGRGQQRSDGTGGQ